MNTPGALAKSIGISNFSYWKVSFSRRMDLIVSIASFAPAWIITAGSTTLMNGLICFSSEIVEGT